MQINPLLRPLGLALGLTLLWPPAGAFELKGYGEIVYSHHDYGPDQKSSPSGAPKDSRATIDLPRFVLEFEGDLDHRIYWKAEIEFEHGGTGAAMELEYEEFGEYEQEVEKGGEILLEQLLLGWRLGDNVRIQAGRLLLPIGLHALDHKPLDWFSLLRPEAESGLLPSSWHESGVGVYIDRQAWSAVLQLVNGLDSSGFDSKHWIRGGHQLRFEQVRADALALAARCDWRPGEGLTLGVSGYLGNSVGNRPKDDLGSASGTVSLLEAHAMLEHGPLLLRASGLEGRLSDAAAIRSRNSRLSTALGVPRTPVAEGARSLQLEAGWNLAQVLGRKGLLRPWLGWARYNSMAHTDAGLFPVPRFDRRLVSGGLHLSTASSWVLKAELSRRSFGAGSIRPETTFSLGLGFQGTFFRTE